MRKLLVTMLVSVSMCGGLAGPFVGTASAQPKPHISRPPAHHHHK